MSTVNEFLRSGYAIETYTVGQLKEAIEELPDDMGCFVFDSEEFRVPTLFLDPDEELILAAAVAGVVAARRTLLERREG